MHTDDEFSPKFWQRRQWLRRIWDDHQRLWTELEYQEQRVLHDYYAPAKDLDGEALIEWLRSPDRISFAKSIEEVNDAYDYIQGLWLFPPPPPKPPEPKNRLPIRPKSPRRSNRRLNVRALATTEFDGERFAKALIEIAREKLRRESEATPPSK